MKPIYLETVLRVISSCLADLDMIDRDSETIHNPYIVTSTSWVRTDSGGFLQCLVPSEHVVEQGQTLSTNMYLVDDSPYAFRSGGPAQRFSDRRGIGSPHVLLSTRLPDFDTLSRRVRDEVVHL